MANDLKPMLSKVLGSGGEKRFYFVYGAGKRKDGKGEGELAVRGQKPKKADIEGELASCNEVHEGVCWVGAGADTSGTVYFQGMGKKISPMVVAKMALTAKRTTGLQYDFQIPSAEEEARASKFSAEENNEWPAAQAAATPATAKTPAAPENLEVAYQARVKALTDGLKKALVSGTAAGNEAKLRFSESQLLSRKMDFPQAMALLDVVEEQIKKALADANGGEGAEPATPATAGEDSAAEWKAKLAECSPAIKAALVAKGPSVADIAKLLAQATALSKPGGDMAQALAKLTECHALATAGATAADPTSEWKAKLAEWSPAIKAALVAKGPSVADIAKLLAQATALSKPGGDMAQALAKLTECHALATAGAVGGDDPAAEWKTKLAAWSPAIKEAMAARGPNAAVMAKLLAQAMALSKPGGDMAQALAKLTECHALAAAGGQESAGTEPQTPTTRWNAERLKAVAKLQDTIKEVVATKDPEADKAELELKAVMKQLNGPMESREQAAEMERYLSEDKVVADVSELAYDVKTPLLKVLAEIKSQLAA